MHARRITVIDDSPEMRDVLSDALADESVQLTLMSAVTNVDEVAASDPDVIMVDLRLGTDHLPGWQVVRHVRSHPSLLDVPVIVCSAALDQMRSYGGASVDARTYLLPKPFSLDDLESVMAEALVPADERRDAPPIMTSMIPEFSIDPFGWFAWVEGAMVQPVWRQIHPRIQPAAWSSEQGHPWRLVRTARGVEVRPDLVSPFLRYGNQPIVSAIGLADEVEVELTTDSARWVGRFPVHSFDLAGLGRTMLEQRKLPHDNLPALFPPPGTHANAAERYSSFRVDERSRTGGG
ncbi:MAG TPA: response regulator [Candidatus Limnocylindria bacterium]|nr:response regulator [Candidatus Limnocylindria bacterium]